MKQIIYTICLILCLSACGKNDDTTQQQNSTVAPQTSEIKIDTTTFNYQKDTLPTKCLSTNEIACAIESVVKCALNPTASYCDSKTMPDFIFYDDAMFADDDGLGRPTKQSFQITKVKPLNDTTIEVFTIGTCDKNWFGNCNGNIIYVLTNTDGKWQVKELYAMENI